MELTAKELIYLTKEIDEKCIDFGNWLTKKGRYNINNWNKTMEEMLETFEKEKKL